MTALDNERGPFRLATRTDTCLPEFVWREALAEDHVCVEPWVRDQAVGDNVAAPDALGRRRLRPAPAGSSGGSSSPPTSCACFPEVRDQAARDNALAAVADGDAPS